MPFSFGEVINTRDRLEKWVIAVEMAAVARSQDIPFLRLVKVGSHDPEK